MPSLSQLEEAVTAYEDEHPSADLIIVVDATFEHRIDEKDRPRFKEAELRGEYISPPAGTVGRGDAFILKIAKRSGAIVLSNDSFQEFHGEHPWLFDAGRLIGGKPVPLVGWIFTPRNPVRGAKSRASTKEAAEKAGPVKKLAVRRPDGSKPKVGDTLIPAPAASPVQRAVRVHELAKELGLESKDILTLAVKEKVDAKSHASSLSGEDADKIRRRAADRKVKASEVLKELGIELKELKEFGVAANVKIASAATPLRQEDIAVLKKVAERSARRAASAAAALEVVDSGAEDAQSENTGRPSRRRRGRRRSGSERNRGDNTVGTTSTPLRAEGSSDAPSNEPLDLVTFLATYEVGSRVEGLVTSFTSHGAMVDVALGPERSFHCYVRTVHLGDPPPTRARDVVRKGEQYEFTLLSIDATRRIAELGLALAPASEATAQARTPTSKTSASKKSVPKKRAPEKSVPRKAGAKKAAPVKAAAKKASPKKAVAQKAAPVKNAAKKSVPKKVADTKAAPAKEAPKKVGGRTKKSPAPSAQKKETTRRGSH